MQPLGAMQARGISADGAVIVGQLYLGTGVYRAGRLVAGGAWTNLGVLSGYIDSDATGVSADGALVTGYCWGISSSRAFRWTEGTGMQSLGTLPGYVRSDYTKISADGSTIVGTCRNDTCSYWLFTRAFRWTSAGGMQPLPALLPAHTWTLASAVSADGTVVAGSSGNEFESVSVVWTPQGTSALSDWLGVRGANPAGWDVGVSGFSTDGLRFGVLDETNPPMSRMTALNRGGPHDLE